MANCFPPCFLSDPVKGWDIHPLHWDLLQDAKAGLLWCFRMCPQTKIPLPIQSNDPDCKYWWVLKHLDWDSEVSVSQLCLYHFLGFHQWWNSTPVSWWWAVETWENRTVPGAGITTVPTTTASAIHFNYMTWVHQSTKMLLSLDFKHQREWISLGFDLNSFSQTECISSL